MAQNLKHLKTSLETTDDGNEDIKQESQIYAKNSMDRFGDDLCALLLSYLTFKDRFRYESVSKQFQRTVFESVVHIDIDHSFMYKWITESSYKSGELKQQFIDNQSLTTIAIKCANIQTIDCREIHECFHNNILINERLPEALHIFQHYCRNLREIYCNLWQNTEQMVAVFGPLITHFANCDLKNKQLLIHCHRLSELMVHSLSDVFDTTSGQLMVKNLQKFEFTCSRGADNQMLAAVVADNPFLKKIVLHYNRNEIPDTLPELAVQLSRLPRLRELVLYFSPNHMQYSMQEFLRIFGQNCGHLQKLSLQFLGQNSGLNIQSLESLKFYPQLKRLKLSLMSGENDTYFSVNSFRYCQRLTHLTLGLRNFKPDFFTDCHQYWPRLQCLYIDTYDHMIDRHCLAHISRLPALRTLEIKDNYRDINKSNFEALLVTSHKLKNIKIIENKITRNRGRPKLR